jgi:methyl-accepting chemotaxis protein
MRDGLREVISSIQKNSLEVAAAAQQVSVASSQVASRSMEQAESASSMALAVETLSTGISGVSENASTTKQIAHEASTRSHTGREAISSTASEMEAIASLVQEAASGIHAMAEKSQQISGIVAVIREIADQTNLLALNAAIEAARAGEQGRGFAVVADEVRKLAERTAQTTLDITSQTSALAQRMSEVVGTMENGVTASDQGVARTGEVSQAIGHIRQNTEQINQHIHGVALALREQEHAMAELGQRLEVIVSMSDTHHHAIESTASAASQLTANAHSLAEAVGHFRV